MLKTWYSNEQWEYQVGPAVGISAGDELWVSRYILEVTMNTHLCSIIILLLDPIVISWVY